MLTVLARLLLLQSPLVLVQLLLLSHFLISASRLQLLQLQATPLRVNRALVLNTQQISEKRKCTTMTIIISKSFCLTSPSSKSPTTNASPGSESLRWLSDIALAKSLSAEADGGCSGE